MKSKLLLEMLKLTKGKRFQHLPGVLVDANGLSVTNLETSVTYRPVSEGKFPFTFDFDGKIESLAKSAKEIEISSFPDAVNRKVQITAEGIKVEIPCAALDEFPPISGPAGRNAFEVFSMDWTEFCDKTIRATEFADKDASRLVLNGVYFEFSGDGKPGSLVATDGKRLAILKGPIANREFKCIIPTAFFKTFYSITKIEKPDYVRILANERETKVSGPGIDPYMRTEIANVWIEAGNFAFNSLLIDGFFPNYRNVLPKDESAMTTTIGPAQKSTIEKACKFADLGKGLEIYRNKLEVNGVEMPQAFEFDGALKFSPMIDPDFLADFTDEDFDVEFWGHDKCMMLHAQDACYAIMPICKRDGNPEYKLFETGELEAKPEVEETPAEKPAEAPAV
jgi:DNA polymerase III sliding clamp (beta) subunit (PCNA family)